MKMLGIRTKSKRDVVDVTDLCRSEIGNIGGRDGVCHLFLLHTTAALTTADLDPGTDLDLLDALDALVPKLRYRHPHDPSHVSDHILSALVGPSVCVPVRAGEFLLGEWQRIVLLEFDGPRNRKIAISLTPEGANPAR